MRRRIAGAVLLMAVLLPIIGRAQVYDRPTPSPQVTAAHAIWQFRGDPIFHAGSYYYPAGPDVFFAGNVMRRTGTYDGVPLYEDGTLEPFSIVFVPIGGNIMRPYEKLRAGELAGSVGSRTPSFPIQRDGELFADAPYQRLGNVRAIASYTRPAPLPPPISLLPPISAPRHVVIGSVPPRGTPDGVWILFDKARWYNSGSTVPYDPNRFAQIGEHLGFPVYREKSGRADRIYIPSVPGGPVAPYEKRR